MKNTRFRIVAASGEGTKKEVGEKYTGTVNIGNGSSCCLNN